MTRSPLFALVTLAALLAACDEKPRDTASQEPTTPRPAATVGAATTTTTRTLAAAPVVRDEDIPTLADFEEEAERDITPANMETELAHIEKDLTAPGAGQQEGMQPGQMGTQPGQTGTQRQPAPR